MENNQQEVWQKPSQYYNYPPIKIFRRGVHFNPTALITSNVNDLNIPVKRQIVKLDGKASATVYCQQNPF